MTLKVVVRVRPVEVEHALTSIQVLECAIRTLLSRRLGSGSYVLRENSHGTAELATELQQFVRTRLPDYKRPRWVEFVPQLPRTATGKIQRFKLREAAEGASRPQDDSAAPGRNLQSHAPADRGGSRNAGE